MTEPRKVKPRARLSPDECATLHELCETCWRVEHLDRPDGPVGEARRFGQCHACADGGSHTAKMVVCGMVGNCSLCGQRQSEILHGGYELCECGHPLKKHTATGPEDEDEGDDPWWVVACGICSCELLFDEPWP
jgi:hypothetical protein